MRRAVNRAVSASGISEMRRPVKISAALKICGGISVTAEHCTWDTDLQVFPRLEDFSQSLARFNAQSIAA